MRARDVHWTAGFLEGEGSFILCSGVARVAAQQVERHPVDKLQSLWGGAIYLKQPSANGIGKRPIHSWVLVGETAAALMMMVFDLMSPPRKQQITKTLQFWKSRGARLGDKHYGAVLTDAEAIVALKRVQAGEGVVAVAKSVGVHHSVLSMWARGHNRKYLTDQIGGPLIQYTLRRRGTTNPNATLADDVVLQIMRRVRAGETQLAMAKEYGIAQSALSSWMRGQIRPYLLAQLQQEEL